MKKIYKRFLHYANRLKNIIKKQELRILPGQVAFYIVLSMIPMVTLVGVLASQFSISMSSVTEALSDILPNQIIDILLPAFNSPSFGVGLPMVIAFFMASNGTCSLIIASNTLFKIESDSYIRKRIKALIMLIILILLFLFMIVVMAFGTNLLEFLYGLFFGKAMPTLVRYLFLLIRWTLGISIMYLMIKTIFTMAPDETIPSRNMTKGAIFTTITWLFATFIYSVYVNNFSNYNVFYSSLAGIVVLMIWIYILSYALIIGIAINSDSYLRKLKEEEKSLEEKKV